MESDSTRLSQESLRLMEKRGEGSLEKSDVDQLLRNERLKGDSEGVGELMVRLLPWAQSKSHPLLSQFRVGAVILGQSGALHFGANFEFGNHPLFATIHAEQSAVVMARAAGERGLVGLAVSAMPCGHCRQVLAECVSSNLWIQGLGAPRTDLDSLLPSRFGPKDLGIESHPFDQDCGAIHPDEPLSQIAEQAMARSYAPYSRSPAGLAIRLDSGEVIAGWVLENAAFNPSLTPWQVCVIQMMMKGRRWDQVREMAFVEGKANRLSYGPSTRLWMEAVEAEFDAQLASKLRFVREAKSSP